MGLPPYPPNGGIYNVRIQYCKTLTGDGNMGPPTTDGIYLCNMAL